MLRLIKVPISLVLLMLLTAQLHASEVSQAVTAPLATLGKLIAALFVVLIVFWLFARIMKQLQGIQGGIPKGLKIIGALPVGQRERVVVVQAGDDQLVLGVTSAQISTLHVLDKPLPDSTPVQSGDFKSKLAAALKREVTE